MTIEQRLTAAFSEPMTVRTRAALDTRVALLVERASARGRRFRLHPARSLLLVVALMILLPLVFVTGAAIFSSEAPFGMGNADSYDAELSAAKAETPIPPGATWPPYLEQADDRSASYGTGLGQSIVEFNAYCLWLGYWYQAQDRGDLAGNTAAMEGLQQARSWRTLIDPMTSDQGFRNAIQRTIDAAGNGDAAAVLHELELNCQGTWPPPATR
jgi:hypothetical protein